MKCIVKRGRGVRSSRGTGGKVFKRSRVKERSVKELSGRRLSLGKHETEIAFGLWMPTNGDVAYGMGYIAEALDVPVYVVEEAIRKHVQNICG